MNLQYDVLVVGAGPAGSTAARFAAAGGARTLLVEKRAEIGTPVRCGEGVAKGWLEEVGIAPSPKFIAHEVDGARVVAPDGSVLEVDDRRGGNECGYVLERDLFDRYLAKEAARAGADILIKTTARELLRDNGQVVGAACESLEGPFRVHAPVVIGADGYESQVGRWAGLETKLRARDVEACLQYTMVGIDGDPRFIEFHLGSSAPGGYAWVFWKGDGIANVGIGVNLSRLRGRAEPRGYLERFLRRHAAFRGGRVLEEVAGGVSVAPPLERTVAPGLMLVGDAARLIDPLTGGGILNGCLSGMYAGQVAAEAVDARDFSLERLMAYERRWRRRLEEQLYRHYLLKERLMKLDDETISRLVRAVAECNVSRMTTLEVLKALRERHPELLAAFEGVL